MIIMGIDPGQTGGIAVCRTTNKGLLVLDGFLMPTMQVRSKKTVGFAEAFRELEAIEEDFGQIDVGICELVTSMPAQGVASSFQFGRMFGGAEALMYTFARTQVYESSAVWKLKLGLTKNKQHSFDLATQVFGEETRRDLWSLKKHEGIAEAALLCHYYVQYKM